MLNQFLQDVYILLLIHVYSLYDQNSQIRVLDIRKRIQIFVTVLRIENDENCIHDF